MKKQKEIKQIKDNLNIHKNKKRVDLSKQFEEFKMRIHEFENKNQQIITRIREAYNPKKKSIPHSGLIQYQQPNNIVHYQNINHGANYQHNTNFVHYQQPNDQDSVSSSCDYSKNIVYNGNLIKNPFDLPPNHNQFKDSVKNQQYSSKSREKSKQQYFKNNRIGHVYIEGQQKPKTSIINDQRASIQSPLIKYQQSIKKSSLNRVKSIDKVIMSKNKKHSNYQDDGQYQQQQNKYQKQIQILSKKNEQLQEQLTEKQTQLLKYKSSQIKFKSYANNLKHSFQTSIQNYQEDIISAKMFHIQKYIKKLQNRLKNASFRLRDYLQDKKSKNNIRRSRQKRNNLKNRKDPQQVQSISSKGSKQYNIKQNQRSKQSRSKQKNKSQTAQKQFKQMALLYETMINTKSLQAQKFERQALQQIKQRQLLQIQLRKLKYTIQQKNNELTMIKKDKKQPKQQAIKCQNAQELRHYKLKIQKLQEQLLKTKNKEQQHIQMIQKLQKNKKMLHDEYLQNLNKNKNMKNKTIQELQTKLRDNQSIHELQIKQIKQKLLQCQQKVMNQQCQMLVISSKFKKAEKQIMMKDEKLKQFESLLLKEQDHINFLDQSLSVDNSIVSMTDVKHLQDNLKIMQEQLEQKNNFIYQLQKQKYSRQNQFKSALNQIQGLKNIKFQLEQRTIDLKRHIQNLNQELQNQKDSNNHRQFSKNNSFLEQLQAQRQILISQKQQILQKNNDLIEEIKKIKELNLSINRQLIKNNTEYNYLKSQIDNLQSKNKIFKDQINQLKNKNYELQNTIKLNQNKHEQNCLILNNQLQNIKKALNEAQNKLFYENEDQNLLNSVNVSQISFTNLPSKKIIEQQLILLKQKNKQIQITLQLKQSLYLQLQNQYKNNLQILKNDIKDKNKQILILKNDITMFKELQNKKLQNKEISDISFQDFKNQIYQNKILQLENQLFVCKENQERLNEMLHQLYDDMKEKQEEREHLMQKLQIKERNYQEIKQLLQLKDLKLFDQKQSCENSQENQQNNRNKQIESSEIIDSFLQLSFASNISDIFKKDEILQQKMKKGKTTKAQNIKLFIKTAQYIKSLKKIIEDKDKRLRILQKQLILMKKNDKKTWSEKKDEKESLLDKNYYTEQCDNDIQDCQQYRDYDSVQIDRRRSRYLQVVKQVQNQKNLAIEQNKLLNFQIQNLQDEIYRAQQQQMNLMKIKDLYKQQISKLIQKNKQHTKQFQAQISRLRNQLDQSQSYHNLQAIKQLIIKMIFAFAFIDDPNNRSAKKQQKRKEIEEYVKVLCSVLQLDVNTRDKLLATIKK